MILESIDAVKHYLQDIGRIIPNDNVVVDELTGGVSNFAYLIEFKNTKVSWVLKQARSKLNVQVDWFCSPERIHREALGIRWLKELTPHGSIVDLIHEDHQNHIIIMSAVPQTHENWKTMLLRGDLHDHHIKQFANILSKIHRESFTRKDEIKSIFQDKSYFEQLRLEPYYGYAAENVPEGQSFLHDLINSTRQQSLSLVHGDYSPKNVLVYLDKLILLDHEVIHWGDPAFDIGFSITHLLSKAHHLKQYRNHFHNAAQLYWSTYQNSLNNYLDINQIEARAIKHTLACLLARVSGRSPLEYLLDYEKAKQKDIVLFLMNNLPNTMPELIDRFVERV